MSENDEKDKKKKPSDEKRKPVDEQMYSALSFAVMLLVIGIPLWWKTTEVYRVSLPYDEINNLDSLKFNIKMTVHMVFIEPNKGSQIVETFQSLSNMLKLYHIDIKQHEINKKIIGSSKSLEEIDSLIDHPNDIGSIQLMEIPGLVRFTPHPIVFGQKRTIYFSSEVSAVILFEFLSRNVLKEEMLLNLDSHIQKPKIHPSDVDSRRRIPLSGSYDILFTIVNPEPERLKVVMDLQNATRDYIEPLLHKLNIMNEFHVKSQWLYFVDLLVSPKFIDNSPHGQHYALSQELLAHVITPLEKKLASHVSQNPCLNFVLWVPPCRLAPVHIYTSSGHKVHGADAFLSSQWGGIQIYNPGRQSCESKDSISTPDPAQVMSIFLQQLRLLLGVTNSRDESIPVVGKPVHATDWEIDNLIRIRTVEQMSSTKLTLQSLSLLLGVISNIVINDEVGTSIYLALRHLQEASEMLRLGQLSSAYNHSKTSFLSSEQAFTHPSLLALLYFPDDQKYAVYIPLFLPVMIPVLISFKTLKEWLSLKFKSRRDKIKTD